MMPLTHDLSPLEGAEPGKTHPRVPIIVAHRGASHDAPENTLAAFELAWRQGADVIEGDFYLTADHQIVCLHDKTTARTAPGQPVCTVADATFEQLQKLDVGSWKDPKYSDERIPTLSQVLKTVPKGKAIFVEIKCGVEILPVLKQELESSGLQPDQIALICFSTDVIAEARRTMDQYQANWLTSFKKNPGTGKFTPSKSAIFNALQQTSASGLGLGAVMAAIDDELVRSVLDLGRSIHVWTVDDPAVAKELRDMGFDSITTNRPAEIRRALQ